MKNILIISIITFAACSTGQPISPDLNSYTTYADIIKKKQPLAQIQNRVVVFNEGDRIPFSIKLDSPVADMADGKMEIILKRTIYAYFQCTKTYTEEKLAAMKPEELSLVIRDNVRVFISGDGKKWYPVYDFRKYREIFGIQSGSVSLGYHLDKNTGGGIDLTVTTK